MKNTLLLIGLVLVCIAGTSQTPVDKTLPVNNAKKVDLYFDYPNLIKVSSGDNNEIKITGLVQINGGEHDEAFELTTTMTDDLISIKGIVKNANKLPQRITAYKDGTKMYFKNKESLNEYKKTHGDHFSMTNWGNDMDIQLEIKIPAHLTVHIESVYGTVELKELNQKKPLTALSTYGGVDAALIVSSVGEVVASSDYGEIYSNLGLSFRTDGFRQGDFHKEIAAKVGQGTNYRLVSKYGNVYMRKAK